MPRSPLDRVGSRSSRGQRRDVGERGRPPRRQPEPLVEHRRPEPEGDGELSRRRSSASPVSAGGASSCRRAARHRRPGAHRDRRRGPRRGSRSCRSLALVRRSGRTPRTPAGPGRRCRSRPGARRGTGTDAAGVGDSSYVARVTSTPPAAPAAAPAPTSADPPRNPRRVSRRGRSLMRLSSHDRRRDLAQRLGQRVDQRWSAGDARPSPTVV